MPKIPEHLKPYRFPARDGNNNGNWKGGISKVKTADGLLSLSEKAQKLIKNKLLSLLPDRTIGKCWEWVGDHFNKDRRPCLSLGKRHLAYRLMFVLYKGPTNSLCVLHTCDNPNCLNPDHLWLGTNQDNSDDMVAKGRQALGDKNGSRLYPERLIRGERHLNHINPERVQAERNPRALLTNEQVREIRQKYRPYISNHKPSNQRELAREYGVKVHVIAMIGKGQTWRSLK